MDNNPHAAKKGFAARFQRFECKYLISENRARSIIQYIQPFVDVDPYASGKLDKSYDITSLYLDSPDLRLYRETVEGIKNRIKLRIRNYSDCEDAPAFLEIKRRFNGLVLKGRARLFKKDVAILLEGGAPDTSRLFGEERACYDEFLGWVAKWLAQPVVWVRYRREAYVGKINRDVRITFDRRLICSDGEDCVKNAPWRVVEDNRVVLELKFNVSLPDWMGNLVRSFDLKQISFSKYGNGVRVMSELTPWRV